MHVSRVERDGTNGKLGELGYSYDRMVLASSNRGGSGTQPRSQHNIENGNDAQSLVRVYGW